MATASQGVTGDQLIWIADAYIRPETYKAALARIINAHGINCLRGWSYKD